MVKTRTDLIATIRHYAEELERLGVPVERIILYGSHQRVEAHEDSDIDLAVFSEAKWMTEPMIEAIGFHPSVLEHINPISFLHEIVSTGEVVYQRPPVKRMKA